MPAAAVIPAPIAYIKVVAVKAFVVDTVARIAPSGSVARICGSIHYSPITVSKLECSKQTMFEYISME